MTSISAAVGNERTEARPVATRLKWERRFFTGIAIAMAIACFAGFAPSYYLKAQFSTPQLKPLVHVHGAVFTLWMLLMIVQTSLISAAKVRLHRQLGMAGSVVMVLMVVTAAAVTYVRGTTVVPGVPQEMVLAFLAIPTVALVLFPSLIGAALLLRKNAAAHKRLMVAGTTVILAAAVHRLLMWLISPTVSPPIFFGATDLFIVAIVVYDVLSLKRVHPATIGGGLAVVGGQIGALLLAGSPQWIAFARWATGT